MKNDLIEKYGNIRVLGFVFFVLASIFCLYKIYDLQGKPSDAYKKPIHTTNLKLLNIIGRHGDRSPTDGFPDGDRHAAKVDFFWPNGDSGMTDIGKMRQFRIGLELRRRYRDFLSFDSRHFLAFSSAITRCRESMDQTLRGLFQIQWSNEQARRFVEQYNAEKSCIQPPANNQSVPTPDGQNACRDKPNKGKNLHLPSGSGSPSEYKNISIDLDTVPTLDWRYLEDCVYFIEHKPALREDLMKSKLIASLKGVSNLADQLKRAYKLNFDSHAAFYWSSLQEELRLQRTTNSVSYGENFYDWIYQLVPGYKPEYGVTYFDLYAQLAVYYYKERVAGKPGFIELGPIVTSIVQSQKQALGQTNETVTKFLLEPNKPSKRFESLDLYANKKAVFYLTHDSVLQALMDTLNISFIDKGDFETRFNKWHRHDDADRAMAGLRTVEFGSSIVFELYETEMKEREKGVWRTTKKFSYVQALFYNEEDVIFKPITYKRLKFGSICRDKFKKIYKNVSSVKHLLNAEFYDDDFPLDIEYSCPFELFKNITSDLMISHNELHGLCVKK
jgi:hypothetical protein